MTSPVMESRSGIRSRLVFASLLSVLILAVQAFAQDPPAAAPPGETDAQWRQRMEERMQQLERENAELRAQSNQVRDTQQAMIKDAEERGILTLESRPDLTTPEFFDLNKYAAEGDFPGSIRIPGTNVSMHLGGFAQVDMLVDFDRVGSRDSFITNTIPTDVEGSGETNLSARQTRVFFKTSTPTKNYGTLITYVEADFFGSNNSAELRLRHAYGEVGDEWKLLGGQTWSVFVDASSFPATLDQQGPAGEMITRRPQFRYTRVLSDSMTWAISLEDPNADISNDSAVTGESVSRLPALASNLRWKQDWGHMQGAALVRRLTFDPDIGSRDDIFGWGLNFTGQIKIGEEDKLQFQLAGGEAIADYMNDSSGLGLDGFFDGTDLNGLLTFGTLVGYQHWWSKEWDSNFIYSYAFIEDDDDQPDGTYNAAHYAAFNLRWHPADRVMIGGEVLYGVREDAGGDTGDALRLQFSAQYKF